MNSSLSWSLSRFFKKKVLQTNHRDVEWPLLENENVQQTTRLLMGGAFTSTDTELTKSMMRIRQKCPQLLNAILPRSEQWTDSDESDDIFLSIQSTEHHYNPVAMSCIS